jgi:hypothetical protein
MEISFNLETVLSLNGLDKLRVMAINTPNSLLNKDETTKSLESLVDEFNLELVPSPVNLRAELNLQMPDGSSWESNGDRKNVAALHGTFAQLSPAIATDERVWVSLAFGPLREYADARWPMSKYNANKSSLSNGLKNKRFAATSRIRWREHAISRLWWLGHYAESFSDIDSSKVADVMFINSDALYNLLGRPAIANDRTIATHVVSVVHDYYFGEDAREFDRNSFRKFLKEIDLRSGRYIMGALEQEMLSTLVKDSFDKFHNK